MKQRLDKRLVELGLAESQEKAAALIMAGEILVNGQPATKAGEPVTDGTRIERKQKPRYVSRGGIKLEAALTHFAVPVCDLVCADIGTSTGGFTDCLLQHGAARVHAVDTGAGQIDWKLRNDPRVVLHENTNARHLEADMLGELVDLAVCDVSFISATAVIAAILRILKPTTGRMIVLVKPQFEVDRADVGEGGIVRDPVLHQAACEKIRACVEESEFTTAIMESPITGAEGNKEFLLYASH